MDSLREEEKFSTSRIVSEVELSCFLLVEHRAPEGVGVKRFRYIYIERSFDTISMVVT